MKKISMLLGKSGHTLFTNGYISRIVPITQDRLSSFYSSVKLLAPYTPPIETQYNIYLTIVEYEVIFAIFVANLLLIIVLRCKKLSNI